MSGLIVPSLALIDCCSLVCSFKPKISKGERKELDKYIRNGIDHDAIRRMLPGMMNKLSGERSLVNMTSYRKRKLRAGDFLVYCKESIMNNKSNEADDTPIILGMAVGRDGDGEIFYVVAISTLRLLRNAGHSRDEFRIFPGYSCFDGNHKPPRFKEKGKGKEGKMKDGPTVLLVGTQDKHLRFLAFSYAISTSESSTAVALFRKIVKTYADSRVDGFVVTEVMGDGEDSRNGWCVVADDNPYDNFEFTFPPGVDFNPTVPSPAKLDMYYRHLLANLYKIENKQKLVDQDHFAGIIEDVRMMCYLGQENLLKVWPVVRESWVGLGLDVKKAGNKRRFLEYFESEYIFQRSGWCLTTIPGPRSNQGLEGSWRALNPSIRRVAGPMALIMEMHQLVQARSLKESKRRRPLECKEPSRDIRVAGYMLSEDEAVLTTTKQ